MKKFSKKAVLLFAAAMALCAFAMPSMTSAASWGTVGTEHTLDGNFGFINHASATFSECGRTQLTADVASAAALEITSATFSDCTLASSGFFGTCTMTSTATNLPWTATAVTTGNVQIHGVNIDAFLENHPGGSSCSAVGITLKITGTLSGARWTGNGAGQHGIELLGSTGLVFHLGALGNSAPITPTGTLSDTQGTLSVSQDTICD